MNQPQNAMTQVEKSEKMNGNAPEGLRAVLKDKLNILIQYIDVCPNNLNVDELSNIKEAMSILVTLIDVCMDIVENNRNTER